MKVLLCHTYYQQRGGEDHSFEEELQLLADHGHEVVKYVRYNQELSGQSSLALARNTLWNRQAARELGRLIVDGRPDVVHCTNTFPLISPAVIHQAHRQGAAIVQALRNYRLICPGSYLMRDGRPCHDCVGKAVPWPAVVHRCYRDSRSASAVVASMLVLHRVLGTWQRKVDAFFTLTEFARQRFTEAGFPADRLHVKYNSVPTPAHSASDRANYVVYVGRLSPEKGVATLLDAWHRDRSLPPLKILGDGPLAKQVRVAEEADSRIEWLGHRDFSEVHRVVAAAQALVMPSVWYETFGRAIAEAYACRTPVIASRLGAMQELIEENRTGLFFEPGNAADLARQVLRFAALPETAQQDMRTGARTRYENHFAPECNYRRLLEIYQRARLRAAARTRSGSRPTTQAARVAAVETSRYA